MKHEIIYAELGAVAKKNVYTIVAHNQHSRLRSLWFILKADRDSAPVIYASLAGLHHALTTNRQNGGIELTPRYEGDIVTAFREWLDNGGGNQ